MRPLYRFLVGPLLAILFLLSTGCERPGLDYPFVSLDELAEREGWEPLTLEELFSEVFVAVLREPEEVELNRIEIRDVYHEELERSIPTVERLIGPIAARPEDIEALVTHFTTMQNYGVGLGCPFEPEILIRFKKGPHQLDMLVNFSCAEVRLTVQGATIHSRELSVSPDTFRLLGRLAETYFPQDPYFRGLSEL